ncbi:hypothetical protein [Streptomyces albipurpureus]|uniref:Holin n=1 Tax=Streptomyces albipurpureus TaxID=2897419 RepID=A0ABT0UF26_9ACTN|nr:hypothetical protein [Streptomyces sp. CWNU-1]MCM2387202.1 hypothetical protein [Streptomyces sp. CWNU-1]
MNKKKKAFLTDPLGDKGVLTKAIPWISIPLVIALTAGVISSDRSIYLKILASVLASVVTVRCIQRIAEQFNKSR